MSTALARGSPEASEDRRSPRVPTVDRWFLTASDIGWRVLVLAAVVWVGATVAFRLYLVTLPLVVALVASTVTVPPTRWLIRHRVPDSLAAWIAIGGGLVAAVGVLALVVEQFLAQAGALTTALQDGVRRATTWLQTGPLQISSDQVTRMIDSAPAQLRANAGRLAAGAVSGALVAAELVAGSFLCLALLYFLTRDGERISQWAVARSPARHRPLLRRLGQRAWQTLAGYVRGIVIIALIDAVAIGLTLLVLGVPLVLPLAVLVFVGAFLPLVGAFVSGLAAVLVAFAGNGPLAALLVLGAILGIQQFEGHVLHPIVMGRAVPLHPVVILMALTAGGVVAGIPGAAFAVPLTAVASAVGNELRMYRAEAVGPTHDASSGQATGPGVSGSAWDDPAEDRSRPGPRAGAARDNQDGAI